MSSPSYGTFFQMIVRRLQPLKSKPAIVGQFGLAVGCDGFGEESRFPFLAARDPRGGFFALPFFEFLLQLGRLRVLLVEDGVRDGEPELLAFVWQLLALRGHDFGSRE